MFEAQSKEGLIYSSLLGFLPFRFTFREFFISSPHGGQLKK